MSVKSLRVLTFLGKHSSLKSVAKYCNNSTAIDPLSPTATLIYTLQALRLAAWIQPTLTQPSQSPVTYCLCHYNHNNNTCDQK